MNADDYDIDELLSDVKDAEPRPLDERAPAALVAASVDHLMPRESEPRTSSNARREQVMQSAYSSIVYAFAQYIRETNGHHSGIAAELDRLCMSIDKPMVNDIYYAIAEDEWAELSQ